MIFINDFQKEQEEQKEPYGCSQSSGKAGGSPIGEIYNAGI